MPPPTSVQAPPPAAAAATPPMYQMMQQQQQQMTQGQNIRPPQAVQAGYPIRAPYHMGQPGMMGHSQQQQWTGLMDQGQQVPTQQPMMQDITQQQQFQPQPEGQNGMMTAGKEKNLLM